MNSLGKLLEIFNCFVSLSLNDKKSLSFLESSDKRLLWIHRIFLISILVFAFGVFNFTTLGDLFLFRALIVLGVVISLAVRFYLSCKILKNQKRHSPSNIRIRREERK
jgi:uncharacterized membrane-anchored protein